MKKVKKAKKTTASASAPAASVAPPAKKKIKTSPSLTEFVDRLKKKVGKEGILKAEKIVRLYDPAVINLAYRLSPHSTTVQLTKTQIQMYEFMKSENPVKAEKWKADQLAQRQAAAQEMKK